MNIYRRKLGVVTGDPQENYQLIGSAAQGAASFVDTSIVPTTQLDDSSLNGIYSYVVTFSGPGVSESRPSDLVAPVNLVNGRVQLDDMPSIPSGPDIPEYDTINIYRNLASNPDQFFLVARVAPGQSYLDYRSDAAISDLTDPANQELDLDGPKITTATLLTNVVSRSGLEYQPLFQVGELQYTGRKGGNALATKTLDITNQTTVGDYLQFLTTASGIQNSAPGSPEPIPPSLNRIPGETGTLTAGATITSDGRLRVVSNNGTGTAVEIPASSFTLRLPDGSTTTPNLGFSSAQEAVGQSASSDFIVYDSLGIPLDVRLTTVLQSRDGDATTYRWFADSGGNDPAGPDDRIAVGTGLISFDGEGNLIQANNPVVNIDRQDFPSVNPAGVQPGLLPSHRLRHSRPPRSPHRGRTVRPSARSPVTAWAKGVRSRVSSATASHGRWARCGWRDSPTRTDWNSAARTCLDWDSIPACRWKATPEIWAWATSWRERSSCPTRTPART